MSWAPRKRFWTSVTVHPEAAGFAIHLDDRPLTTPAKAPLLAPTRALALAIADEWQGIAAEIDPEQLPYTRAVNTAIDRVCAEHDKVVDAVAAYGDADLLCYRALEPEALVRRQAEAWDPWLDWAARALSARLVPVSGVMHRPQPAPALAALRRAVAAHDALALTALYDLVTLSGSLVLGLAVSHRAFGAEEAWQISRVDETWQADQWGLDPDAEALASTRQSAFLRAGRLLALLRRDESSA